MSESGLRVSPQQLIALNDEIAMLVRAGVPLELGLRERGESVPSALRRVNAELSQRMQAGLPLGESLAATLPGLPRVYAAVVDAGLKGGNLPSALESLSRLARQGIELRYRIEFAFLYPLLVFLMAYTLFLVFVIETGDRWYALLTDFGVIDDPVVSFIGYVSRQWPVWAGIPPAIIVVLAGWWFIFARKSFLPDRKLNPMLTLIPGVKSVVVYWHWSNFCDLLATLIGHQIPLPTAISLAADATGNAAIYERMSAVAEDLKSGRSMPDALHGRQGIPPYLRWALGVEHDPQAFQNALRQGMELYRSKASFRADAIKLWLPPVLLLVIGGGAVIAYALGMVLPLTALYWQFNIEGK